MSSSDDSDAEQQRIDLLEQAGRRNRLFLLGLSALLGSLTLGLVGYGQIAKAVRKRAEAFGNERVAAVDQASARRAIFARLVGDAF